MFSNKSLKNSLQLNVSIGSSQSRSESSSTTVVANGSEVKAEGNVHITSTEKDINITGSDVEGKDVTLNAKENLNITASKNTNKTEQNSKSSSASVGVGFDIATGQVSSVTISGSKSKGEVDANSTSYNESTVKADKKLDFTSGKDTNIKGGNLSGEKIAGNVGGDLKIESKQDKNSYKEKNSSAGFGVGIDLSGKNKNDGIATTDKKDKASNANKAGIFGSATKSNVESNYESVTDQSGIYAGKEGFDIRAEANTDLKGGIISSTSDADKNKLSTGTLTFEDIENKADYKAGSIGINVDTSKNAKNKDAGVTPNIGVGAKDNAESVTKATVSEGEIEIRDKGKQKQDLKDLNRDTQNSLNKLGEIFDKTKVEERQELAGLFGEIAYKAVGDLAIKNGWQEGSAEKNALHALVGGIMSELTNSGFLAGASGAMINEMIQDKLSDMFKDNPAMHQWASALIGGVVSQIVAGNVQAGTSTAASGTKNNYLFRDQIELKERELSEAIARGASDEEIKAINDKWDKIDQAQDEAIDALGYPIGNIADGSIENDYEAKKFIFKYAQDKLFADKSLVALKSTLGNSVIDMSMSLIDDATKDKIYQNLKQNIKINANSQGLPNLNYVVEIEPGSNFVMKGVAKLGVCNIGKTAYSIYLNTDKYKNEQDRAIAGTIDIIGLGATVGIGVLASSVGAPTMVIIVGGVVVGYAVDTASATIKESIIGY